MLWRSNLTHNSDIDSLTALDRVLLPPHPGTNKKSNKEGETFRSTGIRSMKKSYLTQKELNRGTPSPPEMDEEPIVEEAKAAY